MSFEIIEPRIPSAIGEIRITFVDFMAAESPGGLVNAKQEVEFYVQVLDGDGNVLRNIAGDLVPHLTQPQIDQLKAFMGVMRVKAETEILP